MLTVRFDKLGLSPGSRVLDAACGRGRHAFEAVRRRMRVSALDLDPEPLAETAYLLSLVADQTPGSFAPAVVRGDVTALGFQDACFDAVIASEILEHVPDDGAAIAQLRRVVADDGIVAVTVPRCGPELVCWGLSREYRTSPGGHIRIYRRSQLVRRLERGSFRVVDAHHAHAMHSPYWWLRCVTGLHESTSRAVKAYQRALERDGAVMAGAERALNPVLGKSLVLYLRPI